MSGQPLRRALVEAERVLREAGVGSPRVDAELLAAEVLGTSRGGLALVTTLDAEAAADLRRLVLRRAEHVPLQHLLGWAPAGAITVSVGPGVFIPRPETDLLLAWGIADLDGVASPVVVDLCTGSGALALGLAQARPDAVVHAVEREQHALAWARKNADARATAGDTPVRLHAGDVTDPDLLARLDGTVHLVLCNPPYVPEGTPVEPEVAEHDPHEAVFGGADGLSVIRPLIATIARLLRPGGAVAMEHDVTHGESVPALFAARRVFTEVVDHRDLTGRPRFVTARRRRIH